MNVPATAAALEVYERVRTSETAVDRRSPKLTEVHWRAQEQARAAFTEVAATIGGQQGKAQAGWLRCQRQRGIVIVAGPQDVLQDDPILEGELAMSDGSTLLLRPDGRGQVRIIEQREAPAAFEHSQSVLAQAVEHVATPRARTAGIEGLIYRVYFALDAAQGAVPIAYRFKEFRRRGSETP